MGLVHICTFILLKLSGERNFAVQLNKPFAVALPCVDFPLFTGSHVDLVRFYNKRFCCLIASRCLVQRDLACVCVCVLAVLL